MHPIFPPKLEHIFGTELWRGRFGGASVWLFGDKKLPVAAGKRETLTGPGIGGQAEPLAASGEARGPFLQTFFLSVPALHPVPARQHCLLNFSSSDIQGLLVCQGMDPHTQHPFCLCMVSLETLEREGWTQFILC